MIIFSHLAPATTSQTEEQTLVKNVPITHDDNVESKLSEGSEPVIDASDETNKSKETVSEIKDIPGEPLARSGSDLDDTVGSLSSAQPSTQTAEKIAEEIGTSSLLKEAPETTEKVVLEETTVPPVAADSVPTEVQPCPAEKEKDAKTELASSATDASLELAVDTQTEQSVIGDEKHAKELSTASEVLTTSPVPIQVAESVLQVEPKESVSDARAVAQEVLSSTITLVHEPNAPRCEALTETKGEAQMNGSAATIGSAEDEKKFSPDATRSAEVDVKTSESAELAEPSQASAEPRVEAVVSDASVAQSAEAPETCVESLQEAEQGEQTKETEGSIETKEIIEGLLECAVSEPVPSSESPVRPVRAKELSAPSVPEAEKSDDQKGPEKVTKKAAGKAVERSTSEGELGEATEGDSTGKKVVKKVVKKVAKKPKSKPEEALDEGAQDSSSVSKQKKTVKVVKKGTKPSQASDTDAAASETPSSSTSDAPVPPKRKSKTTPTKASVKKSDVE